MKNISIKTNLIRVRYKRHDGSSQLKVLAKVGYFTENKFNELRRFEITVRDKYNNIYLVTDNQYARLKAEPPTAERLQLFSIETKIKKIIVDLIAEKTDFTVKKINDKLYEIQNEDAIDTKVKSWNDFLNSVSYEKEDSSYQRDEIERIEKAINDTINEQGDITDEELDSIKDSVGLEIEIEKENKLVQSLNLDERYSGGKFDKNKIIEVFGFCWSKNSKNGDPYIANSYKSLIFHLADYILNGDSVSNSIKAFNLKWVEDFLTFKINKGYPVTHFKGYTPFDIFDNKEKLTKASREYFKTASFQKVVKILKHYINILQKERQLPITVINTNHIDAADFISRATNKDGYTKIEFTLEYEEIEQLLTASLDDPKMQLATDMYIIQMYAGGLRPSELYNGNLRFTENCVSFYRSKNKRIAKNPILPEVSDVLNKYPEGLPRFLNISTYREQLKKVARHFKWKRIITEPNTRIKSNKDVNEYELHEVFSPFTARKTFINYLANLGLPDELIIQFTDHTDVKILKHYKRKLNLVQKKQVIQKLFKELSN
jgi:integrase